MHRLLRGALLLSWLLWPTSAQAPVPQSVEAAPAPETQGEPEPESQALVPTAPPTPKTFTAPNPPSCALEFTDTALHLTKLAASITLSTKSCALNMGWFGQTPWGNKEQWPFHKQRVCTGLILSALTLVTALVADVEAIMFDCFNNNQACGQAIAHAAQMLLMSANSLVLASGVCEPPGKDPPFYSVKDPPLKGFICWATVWHSIQRILKASKFIDVALLVCPHAPLPTMDDVVAPPAPEPEPDEDVPAEGAMSSPNATLLGASPWDTLDPDALPFHTMGENVADSAAEERRLSSPRNLEEREEGQESTAGGQSAEAEPDADWKHTGLTQAKERLALILNKLGIDGVTEDLEPMQDADQIKDFVLSFIGSPPANHDGSPGFGINDDNISNIGVDDTSALWV